MTTGTCKKAALLLAAFTMAATAAGAPAYAAPRSSIVINAQTGQVLLADQPDAIRHPASLTKMMTLLLTFEAIEKGQLSLDQMIPVSDHAAARPPTKLCPGWSNCGNIKVEDAIKALAIKSANDISVALAEAIGGTEQDFIVKMNKKAKELGMNDTNFANPHGLPDSSQVTTARDMATLSQALIYDYNDYYHYFGLRSFSHKGRTIYGHNRLMYRYNGMDGIKTGYINASGFNLAASAVKGSNRIIAIYFGGSSGSNRDYAVQKLLDKGFGELKKVVPPMPDRAPPKPGV